MNDITAIPGKAVIDKQVMIKLLAQLEPTPMDENSNQFHIGYERAKADILKVFGSALGPEYKLSAGQKLILALRNG